MRYRGMSPEGDYMFGMLNSFLVDSPAAVAQAILTRLRLLSGEWFLDSREGTPYAEEVLGYGTQPSRDLAIKERIAGTPGVLEIIDYQSRVSADRRFQVAARVSTIYGPTDTITFEV